MHDILSRIDVSRLKGLTQDSRAVREGYLFAAIQGVQNDGRRYIADAIRHGACVILAPENTEFPETSGVTFVQDANPRSALAHLSAAFYKRQPAHCVAVTGTNGKTSTALFVQQLWNLAGKRSASLGTLGVLGGDGVACSVTGAGSMTTPDPVALHAVLSDLSASGVDHMALEASSHGLDQYRLDGLRIEAAGFTNLSRDHLDYHPDMAEYKRAKMRLFSEVLSADGVAVLNADVPEYAEISAICAGRHIKVISYGFSASNLKIITISPQSQGQVLTLEVLGHPVKVTLPLVGAFQAMNALCALGLVSAHEPEKAQDYAAYLAQLKGAPGRLQAVRGHPAGAGVYVDYAHTPDALETVLKALRPHTAGALVCVFGCGGNRDKGKRPVMGQIAGRLADRVIVTDDNPRSEDPAQIRFEILKGVQQALESDDRREAIRLAIAGLQSGDVLVIAGKGHEQGQVFEKHTDPFDDVDEAKTAIETLRKDFHKMQKEM